MTRFARSLRQLVNPLEGFRTLGVDFISIHEGVDTTTANGRLVFGIFTSVAEFERELVRGRVVSGLAAAKARGQRLGRPTIAINVSQIARLRSEGLSWAAIGKKLGIGESTARRGVGNMHMRVLPIIRNIVLAMPRGFPLQFVRQS
jgi:DNA invertase Pin-like site-specific DNA recombinase